MPRTAPVFLPLLPKGGEGWGEETVVSKIKSPHPGPLPVQAGRGSRAVSRLRPTGDRGREGKSRNSESRKQKSTKTKLEIGRAAKSKQKLGKQKIEIHIKTKAEI